MLLVSIKANTKESPAITMIIHVLNMSLTKKGIKMIKTTFNLKIKTRLSTGVYGDYRAEHVYSLRKIKGYQGYIDTVPVVLHKDRPSERWTVSEPRTGLVMRYFAGKTRKEALEATEKYISTNKPPSMRSLTVKEVIEEMVKINTNN